MAFRRRRARAQRAVVAAALLASVLVGPLVLPHVDPLGDVACSPALVAHDESAHKMGGAPSPDGSDAQHCFLCHWARSFCSLSATREQVKAQPARIERLHTPGVLAHARLAWPLSPGRAPPV